MQHDHIGIAGIGTALPERFVPLAGLPLISPPENLAAFGFTGAAIADDTASLAKTAAQRALSHAGTGASDIDVLLWASALSDAHHRASTVAESTGLGGFCYSASWLQEELALDRATVSGVAQQGCAGMFSALRTARALLIAEPDVRQVLCVGADALPRGACREVLYNVISDAACAVVMSQSALRWRWLAWHQISKGYYWDVPALGSEIIAAYFPTAKAVIQGLLTRAHLTPAEIDLVIPTGVNASSWPILLRLCGIPEDRLYQCRERFGHTIAADSFLLMEEAAAAGAVRPGMRVLLFTYGCGSSWCALLLEATGEVAR